MAFDPWIPEWGNPALVMRRYPAPEDIDAGGEPGTETSKYLKEREINRDALSSGERTGRAQTTKV